MLFFLLLHFICFIFRCSSQMNLCRHSRRLPMAERALNSSARTYHKLHSHIRSYCRERKKERKKLALVGQKNKLKIWYERCHFQSHILLLRNRLADGDNRHPQRGERCQIKLEEGEKRKEETKGGEKRRGWRERNLVITTLFQHMSGRDLSNLRMNAVPLLHCRDFKLWLQRQDVA